MSVLLQNLKIELKSLADRKVAEHSQRYFKTGPGEYGEGDVFIGLRMPQIRSLAKKYSKLSFSDIENLLKSEIHEKRMLAVILLVNAYKKAAEPDQKKIYQMYFKNKKYINNWDLIDVSCPHVMGGYLYKNDRSVLFKLAASGNLWDKRLAVMSTFYFIRNGDFNDSFKICEMLLDDEEDLIHKAAGWMLREIGKRNPKEEEKFLDRHAEKMPRTMLRYALERFSESKRKKYMSVKRKIAE
ncbi:MAG: DNA alkylation repair protein [Spirochaetia bacterium]|nr:DNA alkylation repair protein [Spirochaetia bacterium]